MAALSRRRDEALWRRWNDYAGIDDFNARVEVIVDTDSLSGTRGEFVTLCSAPVEFRHGWQESVCRAMAAGAEIVYSDHQTTSGVPLFKPDFSPDLSTSCYLPFVAVRVARIASVAGESSMERVISKLCAEVTPEQVVHVPEVLARVCCDPLGSVAGVRRESSVSLSVIVPSRDNIGLLESCVNSVRRHIEAENVEIIVVDHCSRESTTREWLAPRQAAGEITVIADGGEFSWSRLNNLGAAAANGEVLAFLNDDVEMTSSGLMHLASLANLGGVGAVGPLLLYPNGLIQHAGVVIGFGGFADHVYAGSSIEAAGQSCFLSPVIRRNVAAVTGACLVTRRDCFNDAGGFDERLVVAGDVEYCLRLQSRGMRIIYDGTTSMIHRESQTRRPGLPASDQKIMREAIDRLMPDGDPWFNRNLSLNSRYPLARSWQ